MPRAPTAKWGSERRRQAPMSSTSGHWFGSRLPCSGNPGLRAALAQNHARAHAIRDAAGDYRSGTGRYHADRIAQATSPIVNLPRAMMTPPANIRCVWPPHRGSEVCRTSACRSAVHDGVPASPVTSEGSSDRIVSGRSLRAGGGECSRLRIPPKPLISATIGWPRRIEACPV